MDEIEWVVIEGNTGREIGAVGFVRRKVVVIVAFYEDADANYDGEVGWFEWATAWGVDKTKVTEVAMAARHDPKVLQRDPDFINGQAIEMFLDLAQGLVAEGLYKAYFSRGVAGLTKSLAGRITSDTVKQFVIRKGLETTIEKMYDRATGR
jgi:hypothetical protein